MKQKLEKVKQWVKDHKEEIISRACFVAGEALVVGGCVYMFANRPTKFDDYENGLLFAKFLDTVDEVRDGGKAYIPMTADEFKAMTTNNLESLRGSNGGVIKVKGLIAFGDMIEEPTV